MAILLPYVYKRQPLNCARNAFTLALKDSADAFVRRLSKELMMVLLWFSKVSSTRANSFSPTRDRCGQCNVSFHNHDDCRMLDVYKRQGTQYA